MPQSRLSKEIAAWFDANLTHSGNECVFWPFGGQYRNKHGDRVVRIKRGDRVTYVSRAVCIEAHGPPPSDIHQAAHTCGMGHKACVNPNHIYWATPSENQLDRRKHGTDPRGEKQNTAKLNEDEVRLIRRLKGKVYQKDIAFVFGLSRTSVQRIQYGKNWSHIA